MRDLEIDLASRMVTVGGEAVQLSAKEYELLVPLAGDPEHVFKEGGVAPRRLELSLARAHAHPRFACEPPAPEAQPLARDRLHPQRVGSGYRLVATAG